MKHPEAAEAARFASAQERAERSLRGVGTGWRPDYGWLVRLHEKDGTRHYHDLPPGLDYSTALEAANTIVETMRATRSIDRVWLEKKMYEPEELRRWQRADAIRTREAHNPYTDDGGAD